MGKERFWYYSAFYGTVLFLSTVAFINKREIRGFIPLVPMTFILAFQYDMCYGTMMERAMQEADKLIVDNPYKFYLPEHSGIVSQE